MFLTTVLLLVALAASASANIKSDGQCPTGVTGVKNFDNSRFLGGWYEYAKYEDPLSKTDCGYYTFADQGLNVTSVQLAERVAEGASIHKASGTYTNDLQDPAKINVVLRDNPIAAYFTGDAYFTYIDYNATAVLYYCANGSDNTKDEMVWIFSREVSLSERASYLLSGYLEMTDFIGELTITNQDNCPSTVYEK